MDITTRRNHKKGNKENTQPAFRSKSFVKREVTKTVAGSVTPFHLKSNEKEGILAKDALQKVMPKQGGTTAMSSREALKKAKPVQRDGRGGAAADTKKRQTLSQAFLTEQAVRQRKLTAEAPPPPAAVPPPKPAPGMYKGRVIESKIGSIWKSKSSVEGMDQKAPAAERQKVGNLMKTRSKSVAELPKRGTQKPQPTRSKSVCDGPLPVSKRPNTNRPNASRPMTGHHAAVPPARPTSTLARPTTGLQPAVRPARATSTLVRPSSTSSSVVPKGKRTQNKPAMPVVTDKMANKPPVTDKMINKPPVSSTLRQYRASTESTEERKAKLAEWLASKGKTLKRPAMGTTVPPKTNAATKPHVQLKAQTVAQVEPQPAFRCEDDVTAGERLGPVAQPEDDQKPEPQAACVPTPQIMDTTIELLDNSDMDLPVDPEPRMSDIVVNLCDALDAMVTPSACEDDEPPQRNAESSEEEMEDSTPKDEGQDEVKSELPEEMSGPADVEVDSKGEEESYLQRVKKEEDESDEEDVESDDYEDDCEELMETPEKQEASVVKYNVKTTPYLQSVRKTIEGELNASGSRRKSAIKDLKFLTPVRRSCRIQRNSSQLPGMLADHDPCVSSLAELVHLDADANAYIYRRNPAILGDLPDDPTDL